MMLSKVRVFNGFPMRMELMVCMGSRNYLNGNKILILVIDHLFNLIRVKMSMPQDPLSTNNDILTRTLEYSIVISLQSVVYSGAG